MELVLASASPRRRQLLAEAGIPFRVAASGFDESSLRHLRPRRQAESAARAKAEIVARQLPDSWVVGCDTVVAAAGEALGQPADGDDAARMLRLLSGRVHSVISAVCVVTPRSATITASAISRVRIAPITNQQIHRYVATGEPFDKAGAYAIQGRFGRYCRLERGRLETVIGLPTHLLQQLLRKLEYAQTANLRVC
jgi:septum formation protein